MKIKYTLFLDDERYPINQTRKNTMEMVETKLNTVKQVKKAIKNENTSVYVREHLTNTWVKIYKYDAIIVLADLTDDIVKKGNIVLQVINSTNISWLWIE